ncbi:MgtC/SapB family protein [Alteriqipengyuania lutimaris]|uniref:Protein MgtC n=1 Tax=Alteriqipengyuania lutimaris TaxID=1538146 RepID=A0A395LKG6_9SPHN|nr:MgtC/SapB family protein [Alteriqipengyuania lutimaris]MBB3033726.1 putative Mg2+ transporter-C (MgtC) family protein [Alteriqipengyuania lutimaris]RDS77291.1 MgtC/SapB family protein [Alteriqipengyuania lutimaris]
MELNPPQPISALDADLVLRLAVPTVLGLLLGLDRELRGHAAGLRTHGLICLASAAMTVSALALFYQLGGSRVDPLRVFEAAAAFLGIIGAGLVVFAKGSIKNVTTAVHLWLTAVIGIACGAALWPIVAIAGAGGLVLLVILNVVEDRVFPHTEANTE